ncbi:HNH endonuclease signature motif containing protein [Paenibacillus tarimensis]
MVESRPSVPSDVKRLLRQEAGFGCAKCGFPFCEYHHIIEYSIENHFRPEDMVAFCPNCHHEATVGAMTIEEQRKYKKQPYNLDRGFAEGQLKINQQSVVVNCGSIQFVNDGFLFVIDEEPLFSVGSNNGMLEISLTLYDKNDSLLLVIDKNNWIQGDPFIWDLEYGFRWIKLRTKNREINLYIDARQEPINIRADLWRRGHNIRINKVGVYLNKKQSEAFMANLCYVGIYINVDTEIKKITLVPDPRFGKGNIISDSNINERIKKGIQALENIQRS